MSEVSRTGFVNSPFSMLAIPELLDDNDAHGRTPGKARRLWFENCKCDVKLEHGGRGKWL